MLKKIKYQEELIFYIVDTADTKKRSSEIKAALNALNNTNEMQEYYFKSHTQQHELGERILRLYGLLQGLFVAIDALYSLAYTLTGSKSFININQNTILKEIKYIRNDVIGHPVRRFDNKGGVAHCIVPVNMIGETQLQYEVITKTSVLRKVDLLECLDNYYFVANDLLEYLWKLQTKEYSSDGKLRVMLLDEIDIFHKTKKINTKHLKEKYVLDFQTTDFTKSRFLWRIDLIEELEQLITVDDNEQAYVEYAIVKELDKCIGILDNLEGKRNTKRKYVDQPVYYTTMKTLLKKEKTELSKILSDIHHPYWETEFDYLLSAAINNSNILARTFLDWINTLKRAGKSAVVYGLWSIL